MAIKIILGNDEYRIDDEKPLQSALADLGLKSESYLAVRDGLLIKDEILLKQGDIVKLVAVISGG